MTNATTNQPLVSTVPSVDFMGVRLNPVSAEDVKEACLMRRPLGLVVTPNVHFIILADRNPEVARLLAGADLSLCDSRIIQRLASFAGIRLPVVTGSDLTRELFADTRIRELSICLVGGQPWYEEGLRSKFGCKSIRQVQFPYRKSFSDEDLIELCGEIDGRYDLCFLCLGAPLQERVAVTLRNLGRERFPTMLCVGASVDFILGAKRRAPKWVQALHLEWLFRLATEPRRLFRRYLIEDIQVFGLYLRWLRRRRT